MMKELTKHFDHYSINARFKPTFFVIFPMMVATFAWCPQASTALGGSLTVLISFGIMSFLSVYVSNIGNDLQNKLFNKWGGAPTTLLLLPSSSEIDKFTKLRYFKWINSKRPDLSLPEKLDFNESTDELVHKVRSAVNFLREYTRDKHKYEKVYRDNLAYGFSRNLVALRYVGIVVSTAALLVNFGFTYRALMATGVFEINALAIVSVTVSVLMLLTCFFILNERFVKRRAFRYAQSLFEVCESEWT